MSKKTVYTQPVLKQFANTSAYKNQHESLQVASDERIKISGHGITKFGELWQKSVRELLFEAMDLAVSDAIHKGCISSVLQIEAVFVANMAAGSFSNQRHLNALASSYFDHMPPAYRLEAACASGGLAMVAATDSLRAHRYKTVLVVGVEKMTDASVNQATGVLATAADAQLEYGSTFPGLYALLAQAHIDAYGTTREHLSAVSVLNHFHALTNVKAHFRKTITMEDVATSPLVADPLRLLDCSPITDGAAAVVLQLVSRSEEQEKSLQQAVQPQKRHSRKSHTKQAAPSANSNHAEQKIQTAYIIGQGHAQDSISLANRKQYTGLQATIDAARAAYAQAHCLPENIDTVELHDCFSIAGIMAVEDLGFCAKGTGGEYWSRSLANVSDQIAHCNQSNQVTRNPKAPQYYPISQSTQTSLIHLNPSGGLKACGHSVGATGVKQIAYLAARIEAGESTLSLAHNVGGSGATAVVHILGSL